MTGVQGNLAGCANTTQQADKTKQVWDLGRAARRSDDSDRATLVGFLNAYAEYYGAYHSHKETMAWTALTLYLAAVGTVVGLAVTGSVGLRFLIVPAGLLAFAFWLVRDFVERQFEAKADAHAQVCAARSLVGKAMGDQLPRARDVQFGLDLERSTPKFIREEMENLNADYEHRQLTIHRRTSRQVRLALWSAFAVLLLMVLASLMCLSCSAVCLGRLILRLCFRS